MSEGGKLNARPTIAYSRCEVSTTLQGGACDFIAEVVFKDLLLCERHAKQIEAQDRVALLEGIVSSLGLCLRSIPLRKNKQLSILLRAQRAQATRELAYASEDLRRAAEEGSS